MRPFTLMPALLLAALAFPAHAATTTVTWSGVVSKVAAATTGPAGPADIVVGTPVAFSATFDPSTAVDISGTFFNIDNLTGLPVAVPGLKSISIADDPAASYSVTIASHVFTQADDDEGGGDFGLGAGDFPIVLYQGSQLLGLAMEAEVGGLAFASDPIADLLHYSRHVGQGFYESDDSDYAFVVDTSLDGAIRAAAVPEPANVALMLAGVGVLGAMLRRRRGARA